MITKQMLENSRNNGKNSDATSGVGREDGVFALYKKRGETPLQCLERLRKEQPKFADVSLSYAGRLDPLASGLLLVLAGDEANKKRQQYLSFDKAYEVEVLFGISTDTYDVLGLVTDSKTYDPSIVSVQAEESLKNISNFNEMEYPPYSSKPVNGKPLFQWAREGRLHEIQVPKQKGKIKGVKFLGAREVGLAEISESISVMVTSVSGDFRQNEILNSWKNYFNMENLNENTNKNGNRDQIKNKSLLIVKMRIECESGVYMRSMAQRLGQLLEVPALAFGIVRTQIGDFILS